MQAVNLSLKATQKLWLVQNGDIRLQELQDVCIFILF